MKLIKTIDKLGEQLYVEDISNIIDTVNSLTEVVNAYLKKYFDVNAELDTSETFTLLEAVTNVPDSRRRIGMTVRFMETPGEYRSVVYIGTSLDSASWVNKENWVLENSEVDGGTWK